MTTSATRGEAMINHDEAGCVQAGKLGKFEATLEFFQKAEIRREERETRMLTAMESVAAQGEAIKSLQETAQRHDKSLNEAFGRIKKVENPPLLVKFLSTRLGRYVFAGLVGGCLVGITRNPEAVGKIVQILVG
jgi:hypothetical protein